MRNLSSLAIVGKVPAGGELPLVFENSSGLPPYQTQTELALANPLQETSAQQLPLCCLWENIVNEGKNAVQDKKSFHRYTSNKRVD